MHIGQAEITVDPTKKKPWYVSIGEQLLEANKVRQVQQINAQRMAQGLPPLSQKEMNALTGAVKAQVELPQDLKTALYIGGAAAIGLLFFALNKRR